MKKLYDKWLPVTLISMGFCVIMIIIGVFLFEKAEMNKAITALDSYNTKKDEYSNTIYGKYYDLGYKKGEEQHHVSNECSITIDEIRQEANLEVLKVSDITYITDVPNNDSESEKGGNKHENELTSWLEVPGEGVFTVNLELGEFIIDNERHIVYVRVPKPELNSENIKINTDNVKVILFESNGIANGSYNAGEKKFLTQIAEAREKIENGFISNQEYYSYARESAERIIKSLVKSVNFDIDDLEVYVDFYD